MSVFHVGQIETHLRKLHQADHWVAKLDDRNNLSRLLALHAIGIVIGEAAYDGSCIIEITDGTEDRGIDAIAVDPTSSNVVVVQSKWRADGSGSVDLGSILKFLDGVRTLLNISNGAPLPYSERVRDAVRTAMVTPGGHIQVVVATTAQYELSDEVIAPVKDLLEILNDVSEERPIAEFKCLTQASFFDAITQTKQRTADLDVSILDWGRVNEPTPAYYGRISALSVAEWYAEWGTALFAENIRVVLPKSDINDEMLRTLRTEPQNFWYYNNGVTLLAGTIERSLAGSANRDAGFFRARQASIVNGAQTASTLGRALAEGDVEALQQAYVPIRCIELSGEADNLARNITRFANTQNVVSSQDFVFLDKEQHRLVKELRLLGYEYLLRSGEVATSRDKQRVLDARQAAVALACASPELNHAVIAKREVSRLFDRTSGIYSALFNPAINGLVVARAFEILRTVEHTLQGESRDTDGIRSGIAVHAPYLVAHVILNQIRRSDLTDINKSTEDILDSIRRGTLELLDKFADNFPAKSYPGNLFKNQTRCRELLSKI